MVLYLCSDKAGFITGENICIDGGMTRQMIYHGNHGWRGGYLTREVLRELLAILEEEAAKKQKYVFLSLNWPQAVLQVSFRERMPEQQVVMETANEGELSEQ